MNGSDYTLSRPLSPDQTKLVADFWKMSPWEQERFLRFTERLADRDPEAVGLGELYAAGKITRLQLFELI